MNYRTTGSHHMSLISMEHRVFPPSIFDIALHFNRVGFIWEVSAARHVKDESYLYFESGAALRAGLLQRGEPAQPAGGSGFIIVIHHLIGPHVGRQKTGPIMSLRPMPVHNLGCIWIGAPVAGTVLTYWRAMVSK